MRQIKFRAWDKETKTIVPWELISRMMDGAVIATNEPIQLVDPKDFSSEPFYANKRQGNPFICPHFEMMQFTGLLDKNGKEIYEGDVVKIIRYTSNNNQYGSEEVCLTVKWFESGYKLFPLKIEEGQWILPWDLPASFGIFESEKRIPDLEVIGDIYSNPDLLK